MQCFWGCLPWTVACSLRKDVTSTFVTYCLISLHWVLEQWATTAPDTLSAILTCIQPCTCFSSSQLFCWMICFQCNTQWHVPFLLFLQNWMSIPHWKKKTIETKWFMKHKLPVFPNCGGWGLGWAQHNSGSQRNCRRSSRHPHFILIFYSVWCFQKTAYSKYPVLVLCVSPTWLVKKQLAFQ